MPVKRRGGNKRLDVDIRAAQVKLRGGGVKALARKLHLAEEAYVGERVYQRVFLVVAESGGAEIDAFKAAGNIAGALPAR